MSLLANSEMCAYCFEVLLSHFGQCTLPEFPFDSSLNCPMFVTLDTLVRGEKRLRGCIGTLSSRPLTDLNYFVLSSAFRDKRFPPLELQELSNLVISVSLLVNYEQGQDYLDWEVGIHGIIIEFDIGEKTYSATYLPDVAREQGWNQLETIKSLVKKSGYNGSLSSSLYRTIKLTRYQSSKASLKYNDYLSFQSRK